MLRAWFAPAVLAVAACGRGGDPENAGTPRSPIILATTTSTQDSGLIDVLVPRFTKDTGIEVKTIAVGSGAALRMAARGDIDVILAHAPSAEREFVDSGDLVEGRLVMHNDFVLVGPPEDLAGVKRAASINAAMAILARTGGFASRGDDSGTHKKELELWRAAGIDPRSVARREEIGQGMGATLRVASERGLYTLTDRGTYLAQHRTLRLAVAYQGAASLLNIYHAHLVSPVKHVKVKAAEGRRFLDFLVSPDTQRIIGEFGKARYGEPLFVPDAGKDPTTLGPS